MAGSGNAPEINTLIELAVQGGEAYPSRVEDRQGDRLTVVTPPDLLVGDVPEVGRRVTLRWPAGPRGLFSLPAEVVQVHLDRVGTWDVKINGPSWVEQNRRFVRGGGGEPIRMMRVLSEEERAEGETGGETGAGDGTGTGAGDGTGAGAGDAPARRVDPESVPPAVGKVVDLSERSVRGLVGKFDVQPGDQVTTWIGLGDDVIKVSGTVQRVLDNTARKGAGVVVVFEPDEDQATTIRRYVLRQQMLARSRGG